MYLVVVQSTVMALLGGRLGWHRMVRTGAATAHLSATAPPPHPVAYPRQARTRPEAATTGPRWPIN